MAAPCKVLTVLGTRPEAVKLFPLVHTLEADARFRSVVCSTGQHRAMLDQVLDLAGIVPDHDLDVMEPGQSLDALTARLLTGIGAVLDRETPGLVVVQGDTTSAFAGALAAHYRRLPVVHVEAGLRSGDLFQPWPEEANRRMIGRIAALHCAPTRTAEAALVAENVAPGAIAMTGNTVIDALHWVVAATEREPALASEVEALRQRFAGKRVVAVTTHRRENWGEGFLAIAAAIARIAARPDVAVIFPVHLNPEIGRVMRARLGTLDNVALIEPLDYPGFARLLAVSDLVLTDSGGVQEEAPALGKPVLVMRETTERPEGVEAGTARLVGTDADRIVAEAARLLDDDDAYAAMAQAHNPYGDGRAAQRIVGAMKKLGMRDD